MNEVAPEVIGVAGLNESFGSDRPEHDAARLQTCFNVLARVEDQLRFADSKAGFIATLHAFLIGPLAGNVPGMRSVVIHWGIWPKILLGLAAGIYFILFIVTNGIVAATVLPRNRRSARAPSKAFFGRIAKEYGHVPERFVAEIGAMSDEEWLKEIGQYIVDASGIASVKHRLVRLATVMTVPTVIFWILMVLVLMCAGRSVGVP
jgi:hypothetical protein